MPIEVEKPRVLVVDDVPANLIAMKATLKGLDITIATATSGNDALRKMLEDAYALVLLDVQMPGMDGYEVAELMRGAEHTADIPIIFVTAYSRERENVLKGYEVGAVDYITKPIDRSILCGKVRVFTDLYRQRAQLLQLNEELDMARASAEAATRMKSEFLANMSHELRTPMHAILSYSRLGSKQLQKGTEGLSLLDKYFTNIRRSGERLARLLNDLLDLSKMEAGKMRFHFHRESLQVSLRQALLELQPLLEAKNLTVNTVGNTDDAIAYFDPERMIQVLVNLLSNAIKFSPEGGVITITLDDAVLSVHAGEEEKTVPALQLQMADEGIGIPENELENVFDHFIQSSKTKTGAGGTGLGLSICRDIILAHHGEIKAGNNLNGGACLTFVIPREAVEPDLS